LVLGRVNGENAKDAAPTELRVGKTCSRGNEEKKNLKNDANEWVVKQKQQARIDVPGGRRRLGVEVGSNDGET